MRAAPVLFLALAACSGNDGDDGSTTLPAGCDAITTEPLSQVPAQEWPEGTASAIDDYLSVAGRWDVDNSCGEPLSVKITIQSEELLDVVQEPWPSTRNCGCLTDPAYENDSDYDLIALHSNFQFFVESFDDPGVVGQTVVGAGALYSPGQPLRFRGCGTQNIDPVLNSEYDLLSTIMRIDSGGIRSGEIVLSTDAGETTTCTLSNWTLVASDG